MPQNQHQRTDQKLPAQVTRQLDLPRRSHQRDPLVPMVDLVSEQNFQLGSQFPTGSTCELSSVLGRSQDAAPIEINMNSQDQIQKATTNILRNCMKD